MKIAIGATTSLFDNPWTVMHATATFCLTWLSLVFMVEDGLFDSAPYRELASIAPQYVWAIVMLACATAQVSSILIGKQIMLLISSVFASCLLALVSICLASSSLTSTSWESYAIIATQAFVISMREAWEWGRR